MFKSEFFSWKLECRDRNIKRYTPPEENVFDLVHTGNYNLVLRAVQNGTDVNQRDGKGRTLLLYALDYHQERIAKLLISKGADLEAKDNIGRTIRNIVKENHSELSLIIDAHVGYMSNTSIDKIQTETIGNSGDTFQCCICQ